VVRINGFTLATTALPKEELDAGRDAYALPPRRVQFVVFRKIRVQAVSTSLIPIPYAGT